MNPDGQPAKKRRRGRNTAYQAEDFVNVQEVLTTVENTSRGYLEKTTTIPLYPINDPSPPQSTGRIEPMDMEPMEQPNAMGDEVTGEDDVAKVTGHWKVLC